MANPPEPTVPGLTLDGENGMAKFGKKIVPTTLMDVNQNEVFFNYNEFIAFLSRTITIPAVDPSKLAITPNPALVYPPFQRAVFPPTPGTRLPTASKVVLVVGGSRNLGKIISLFLSSQGYTVIATSRNPSAYFGVNRNPLLSNVPLDVRVQSSVDHFFQKVIAPYGRLDILIMCQGVITNGPLVETPTDYLSNSFEIKIYGALRCVMAALPYMRLNPDGRVLSFSSVGGCEMDAQPLIGGYNVVNHSIPAMIDAMDLDERILHAFGYITNPVTYITIEPIIILSTIDSYDSLSNTVNPQYKYIKDSEHIIVTAVQSNLGALAGFPASGTAQIGQQIYDIVSAPQPGLKYFIGDPTTLIGGIPYTDHIANSNRVSDVELYNTTIVPQVIGIFNAAAVNSFRAGLIGIYAP